MDETYYEMGSTQSKPCSYKSSEAKDIELIYKKKRSDFRPTQVPTYGPVGENSCMGPGDRFDSYSTMRYYESLTVAKKCCNIYRDCDIIVEVDQSQGMYHMLYFLTRE